MSSGAKFHTVEMCFNSVIRKQKYFGDKQTRKTMQLYLQGNYLQYISTSNYFLFWFVALLLLASHLLHSSQQLN